MRLITFVYHNDQPRLGALVAREDQDYVLDLNRAQPEASAVRARRE